jgi:hypothetical protein
MHANRNFVKSPDVLEKAMKEKKTIEANNEPRNSLDFSGVLKRTIVNLIHKNIEKSIYPATYPVPLVIFYKL